MARVIAELCQNHNGDVGLMKEMVAAAADAGADIVKIQAIFTSELTHRPRFDTDRDSDGRPTIVRPFEAERDRLAGLEISYRDMEDFIDACSQARVEPMCTAFTRAQVAELAKLPWRSVKVASYDCASPPLLTELAAEFDHLYVSTGATTDDEVRAASALLRERDVRFTLLHCVTVYPTPRESLHLNRISWLKTMADEVGFSNHSLATEGIAADAAAIAVGAEVVERHFTILDAGATKDGPVSLDPTALGRLCALAHGPMNDVRAFVKEEVADLDVMLGDAERDLSEAELLNRDYYRGRFASKVGDEFVYNWEACPIR